MEVEWYYTQDGAHVGPVSQAELEARIVSGAIGSDAFGWQEGMEDWIELRQLFPHASGPTHPAPTPAHSTSGEAQDNPYAAPNSQVQQASRGAIPRRNLSVKRVNVPLWFALWGMFFGGFIVGMILMITSAVQNPNQQTLTPMMGVALALFGLALLVAIPATLYSYMILYRMWWIIQEQGVRTTPGKAVGFSFIPFFNIYWLFVAYYMWSTDYNRFVERYGAHSAPRTSENLFLFYCIGSLVGGLIPFGVGLIVLIVLASLKTTRAASCVNYFHDLGAAN